MEKALLKSPEISLNGEQFFGARPPRILITDFSDCGLF